MWLPSKRRADVRAREFEEKARQVEQQQAQLAEEQARLADDRKALRDIRWELQQQRKYLDVIRSALASQTHSEVSSFCNDHRLSLEQTMKVLVSERISFTRFGDGEFRMMLRPEYNLSFQPSSPGLADDLRDVLLFSDYDPEVLMLGFPFVYHDLHWSGVLMDVWPDLKPLLREDLTYGCSHVSRPIFFEHFGESGVDMWRELWADQRVCVVTGRESRFALIDPLFDNIQESRYVYSEAVNAYADLPRLMEELEREDPEQLFLVSLGPTGTLVTAYLARMGRWAVDVGHISTSWAAVFDDGAWPESTPLTRAQNTRLPL